MELVTSPHPVQAKPKYSLTPLALLVTLMPGREAGSLGQRPQRPYDWTRFGRGPLIADREVRGPPEMWWHRACLANSETLVSLLPRFTKGPPSANGYNQGIHHWGVKRWDAVSAVHTNIRACVLMYMHLYNPTNTLRGAYTRTHSRNLIWCRCSQQSPPTWRWRPCQFTCQWGKRGALSAPEIPPIPPIHSHSLHYSGSRRRHQLFPFPPLPSDASCDRASTSRAYGGNATFGGGGDILPPLLSLQWHVKGYFLQSQPVQVKKLKTVISTILKSLLMCKCHLT